MELGFEGVGQEPELRIWRIEQFEVCSYERSQYGKFYEGDCYIVLNTRLQNNALLQDVHFWLGKESSQDEYGTAAIKTVELDDILGGDPVQHREVQQHESDLFLSYFKHGVQYLKGGVASGFRHVTPDDYEPALFHVKGRRNVRVKQVELTVSCMNQGDCFILDTCDTVYVYVGPRSRHVERLKAIQAATAIRDNDHAGSAKVIILDENAEEELFDAFFAVVQDGGREDVAEVDSASDDDLSHEAAEQRSVALYLVSDAGNNSIDVQQVTGTPLSQQMLVSGDCFILDTGRSGLYVWIGRDSSREERQQAMRRAAVFLEQKQLPSWTKMERVVEKGEPAVFKTYFADWIDADSQTGFGNVYTVGQLAETLPDVELMSRTVEQQRHLVSVSAGGALGFQPDDGGGRKVVYRIENLELEDVDEHRHGMFFGGDSYVIQYTYQDEDRVERYIIYFWLGKDSSLDERAAAAMHAVRLDDQLCGRAVQIRVTQGHEPRHFLTMFHGCMVVFLGGRASSFRNVDDSHTDETVATASCRLFQVRGLAANTDCRAVQLPLTATGVQQLQPTAVYVILTAQNSYIYYGESCCAEERALAGHVIELVSPETVSAPVEVQQGTEPEALTQAITSSATEVSVLPSAVGGATVALYGHKQLLHCSIDEHSGRFECDAVEQFDQECLNADDVMLLDTGDEVYCWLGDSASQVEIDSSFATAERMLGSGGRRRAAPVIRVKQGQEPRSFRQHFPHWSDEHFEKRTAYDDVKSLIAQFNQSV